MTAKKALLIVRGLAAGAVQPVRAGGPKPIRALVVIGGCCRDYAKQRELTRGVSERAKVDTDTGTKHLNPVYERLTGGRFDAVVHDEWGVGWSGPIKLQRCGLSGSHF
jgi:hypothetical protein